MGNDELREKLRQQLADARAETGRLFQMVLPAGLFERPIPERHRLIFYLGHFEAFDWNMICVTALGMKPFNPQSDRLFSFGIDPVDGRLPQDQPGDWPRIDRILNYYERVRKAVDDALETADFENPSQPYLKNGQIFHVAIEHRLMHAETLAYMMHWVEFSWKKKPKDASTESLSAVQRVKQTMIDVPAGEARLGQDPSEFGWDNEFKAHSISVPEFSIDALNVTNADFLKFIEAGGYEKQSFWTDEGWNWIQNAGVRHPKFWTRRDDQWFYRTMFEDVPLPEDWPVYVSHAEATAYAKWKGKSLPTEAQYHRAASGAPLQGNFDFKSWTPEPVGAHPENASEYGVHDLIGNGWEWTSTPFAPFEGFEPFPFYPGYSKDFFDGKHFVLKGASPRTSALLVRPSFRNWFQAYYPNVYAKFRCVG